MDGGAGGGAGSAGGEPSGGGLPEFVEIDAPGVKLSRDLAWDGQGDTCKPPGPRIGPGGAQSCACNGGGGPGVGNPPACGVLAVAMAYRLLELAQERGVVGVCSPRAWGGRIARRREPTVRSGRRR